jgi:hypothetical protein
MPVEDHLHFVHSLRFEMNYSQFPKFFRYLHEQAQKLLLNLHSRYFRYLVQLILQQLSVVRFDVIDCVICLI